MAITDGMKKLTNGIHVSDFFELAELPNKVGSKQESELSKSIREIPIGKARRMFSPVGVSFDTFVRRIHGSIASARMWDKRDNHTDIRYHTRAIRDENCIIIQKVRITNDNG